MPLVIMVLTLCVLTELLSLNYVLAPLDHHPYKLSTFVLSLIGRTFQSVL